MIKDWVEQFNRDTACEGSTHDLDLFFGKFDRSLWITKLFEVGHYINELDDAESYNMYVVGTIPLNDLGNRSKPPKTLNNRLISSSLYCVPEVHLSKTPIFHANFKEAVAISENIGLNVIYVWNARFYDSWQLYLRYLIIQMNPTNNT